MGLLRGKVSESPVTIDLKGALVLHGPMTIDLKGVGVLHSELVINVVVLLMVQIRVITDFKRPCSAY